MGPDIHIHVIAPPPPTVANELLRRRLSAPRFEWYWEHAVPSLTSIMVRDNTGGSAASSTSPRGAHRLELELDWPAAPAVSAAGAAARGATDSSSESATGPSLGPTAVHRPGRRRRGVGRRQDLSSIFYL